MRKLNKNKVFWIIGEWKKGELSKWRIAKQMGISTRWVNELIKRYQESGDLPVPGRPGKTPMPVTRQEVEIMKNLKEEFGLGAIGLEKLLAENGFKFSHNRIHKVLKIAGLAKTERKSRLRGNGLDGKEDILTVYGILTGLSYKENT